MTENVQDAGRPFPPQFEIEKRIGDISFSVLRQQISMLPLRIILPLQVVTASFLTKAPRLFFRRVSSRYMPPPLRAAAVKTIEVEEKFALGPNRHHVERRLQELGFTVVRTVDMIDWYFDNVDYCLIRQDCWLRCREINNDASTRQWQVKQGRVTKTASDDSDNNNNITCSSSSSASVAAVYEEVEGDKALELVSTLLSASISKPQPSWDSTTHSSKRDSIVYKAHDDAVLDSSMEPLVPMPLFGLHAFAKIVTLRSSWKTDRDGGAQKYQELTVDLDTTDYDYGVGEVEAVVNDANQVEAAKRLVHELIQDLNDSSSTISSSSGAPVDKIVGKMEYYLKRYRPDVYQICLDCGVI